MIDEFEGIYVFLSNFYLEPVDFEGLLYPSAENAYQAQKTEDLDIRYDCFTVGSPANAKRQGQLVKIRKDWEEIKVGIMRDVLAAKFAKGSRLASRLLDTGNQELVEGNWWGDTYWGVCGGRGKNMLGQLLMKRRAELMKYS